MKKINRFQQVFKYRTYHHAITTMVYPYTGMVYTGIDRINTWYQQKHKPVPSL